jgi:hypothetical protein
MIIAVAINICDGLVNNYSGVLIDGTLLYLGMKRSDKTCAYAKER